MNCEAAQHLVVAMFPGWEVRSTAMWALGELATPSHGHLPSKEHFRNCVLFGGFSKRSAFGRYAWSPPARTAAALAADRRMAGLSGDPRLPPSPVWSVV